MTRIFFRLNVSILSFVFIFLAGLDASPAFLASFPKESFHMLKSEGKIVGRARTTWAVKGAGLEFTERSEIKLTLFRKLQSIDSDLRVETDGELRIQAFAFVMNTENAKIEVLGKRQKNQMRLEVKQAGRSQVKDVPFEEPTLMSPLVRPFLLKKGLPKSESRFEAQLLEPSAMTTVPMEISIRRGKDQKFSVRLEYLSQEMTSEIENSGHLVREVSNLAGLAIEATPISAKSYEKLLVEGSRRDLVELAKVEFPLLSNPKNLKEFRVSIEGIQLSDFELTRHRQKRVGNILEVVVEKEPFASKPVQSLIMRKDLEPYLKGDASIPVNDPKIQAKAKEIIGTESDLWLRAKKIHDFVFKSLEKKPTISVPNALEVLDTRRGDCNEHAVLYTALARAAGVPTRTVVGLVFADQFYGDPGFYYHAWVEVFTGAQWVAIDPTWNQIPADATHLAFVEGSLDQQVKVTSLMGRIRLKPAPRT